MKRLFIFLACCLPIYLFAQGFGSFSHDQPYFAKDVSAASSGVVLSNIYSWWIAGSNVFQNVDGTVATTNGSFAKYWGDFSGNGYNLTNSSGGPVLVTNIINGYPIMYFGTNANPLLIDTHVGGGYSYTQPYWVFMVVQRGDVTGVGQQNLITQNDVGNPGFYAQSADPSGFFYAGGSAAIFPGFPLSTPYAYGVLYSNELSVVYTNGVLAKSGTSIGPNNAVYTRVGGHTAGSLMYHGGFAEILIYTNYLSSNVVWKVQDYIIKKYFNTNAPLSGWPG